jgi:glycosyltransferase involved in cell wall biosynthesis
VLAGLLVIIPAYNEEACLGDLIPELRRALPGVPVLVISDGSRDATCAVASSAGAAVLDIPCNLGVGGAVQAGFQYAVRHGFSHVVRIDADGQHPPAEILKLIAVIEEGDADLVIGSRFGATTECVSTRIRYFGIRILARFLSAICRSRVTDPTSGFWLLKRPLLDYFAAYYPSEYPEPEALALMRRQGYAFREAQVTFRPRMAGHSSIRSWGTVYYAVKVGLALVVDRVRVVNRRFEKSRLSKADPRKSPDEPDAKRSRVPTKGPGART